MELQEPCLFFFNDLRSLFRQQKKTLLFRLFIALYKEGNELFDRKSKVSTT